MRLSLALLLGLATASASVLGSPQQTEPRPTFRSGVARVSVAATVVDRRGRPVTTLPAADFDLYDNGQRREILEFSRDTAPIGVALLTDVSGSMDVAEKRATARAAVKQ